MRSQVSCEGEVELKCLRVSEVLFVHSLPPMGRLASPFIVQGEDRGYTRERERQRGRGPRSRVILPLLYTGHTGGVDDDEDGSTS
jgi:hypothetical protein